MTSLHLGKMWQKQYGFLRLANFVTGGDCATIEDTAGEFGEFGGWQLQGQ